MSTWGRWTNGYLGDVLNRSRPPVAPLGAPGADLAAIETCLIDASLPTVIAFGGMAHQLMMPTSAFISTLSTTDVNVLFIKDLRQCWYQRGLRGLGNDPQSAAWALLDLAPKGSSIVGAVGTSSGGTGALLMGALLGVERIVAFSPRTLVDRAAVRSLRAAGTPVANMRIRRPYCDMALMLDRYPVARVDIHVGARNAVDVASAQRLEGLPGVSVHLHDTSVHTVARFLRDQGRLGPLLREGLGLRPTE